MANLRAIRKRIGSVKNTQQITRAMKMVSGAKLRRAEERAKAFRPYAEGVERSVQALLERDEGGLSHPLMEAGVAGAPPLFVLVASDRGLCGGFNSNVFKQLTYSAEDRGDKLSDYVYYTVGKRTRDWVRRRELTSLGSLTPIPEPPTPEAVAELSETVMDAFTEGAVGSVTFVYNEYVNALTQRPTMAPVLPLKGAGEPGEAEEPASMVPFLTEPPPAALLGELIPRLVEAKVEGILHESIAGEHGARMTAMDAASNNASEMIDSLSLTYNRARQAAITSELLDIINGKNAVE